MPAKLPRTLWDEPLNVGELREMLDGLDDDTPVHVAYDFGDHWHNTVAPAVQSAILSHTTYSDYHQTDRACFSGPPSRLPALILSARDADMTLPTERDDDEDEDEDNEDEE